MSRLREYLPLSLAAVCAYALIFATHQENVPARWKEKAKFLAPPPEHIEMMHFGFKGSLADSLWLRWIQDGDYCFNYAGGYGVDLPVAPPAERFGNRFFNPRNKNCDSSWGFKMLDAVTKLDEMFKMPYMAGGMTLSVIVEDYAGASIIFERGLKNYPDDWQLSYRAAYHFLFDREDYARAAQLLDHAAAVGGPTWLKSLAARMYSRVGQLELGLSSLLEWRKAYKEGDRGLKDVDERIEELRKQLAQQQSQQTK